MPAKGETRKRIAREYAARLRAKRKAEGLTARGEEYKHKRFDELDLIALVDPTIFKGRGLDNGKWAELFTQEKGMG